MMLRQRLIFALTFTSIVTTSYAADASAFLGKWELDKSKTQGTGAPEDLKMEIKKNGEGVVIKSRYQEPKNATYPLLWVGIMTYELPLSIDGTETKNTIGPFTHVSKTMVDGNKMTTDFTAQVETGNVMGQWIREVSASGKEMSCHVLTKASDGRTLDQTLYFKKK